MTSTISIATTNNAAPHRKNAAQRSRSDSPYQQRTTQRDNPTQLLIKQAVDYLIQQLEAGKSETLTAYLNAMARFHSYSFGNILQIARQRPTATRVINFLAQQNIALEFNEKIAPALGVSYGGKIALLPGQSKAEEFVSLVHETAHELLHKAERRTMTTQTVRETEAEAVAFIVGQAVGLEMGNASSDYIQMYAGNAALLAESLEVIQRTASTILRAIRPEEPATTEAFAAAS